MVWELQGFYPVVGEILWYFHQLWLSFSVTLLSPRPLGTMAAPIVAVLSVLVLFWVLVRVIKAIRRSRMRKLRLAMGKLRAGYMSPTERAKYLHLLMEDIVARELEISYLRGDMTDDERAWLYRELALKMGYAGLLPYYREHRNRMIAVERSSKAEANRKLFFEAQEKQQDKGIAKATTLLEILGDEEQNKTLGDILEGK